MERQLLFAFALILFHFCLTDASSVLDLVNDVVGNLYLNQTIESSFSLVGLNLIVHNISCYDFFVGGLSLKGGNAGVVNHLGNNYEKYVVDSAITGITFKCDASMSTVSCDRTFPGAKASFGDGGSISVSLQQTVLSTDFTLQTPEIALADTRSCSQKVSLDAGDIVLSNFKQLALCLFTVDASGILNPVISAFKSEIESIFLAPLCDIITNVSDTIGQTFISVGTDSTSDSSISSLALEAESKWIDANNHFVSPNDRLVHAFDEEQNDIMVQELIKEGESALVDIELALEPLLNDPEVQALLEAINQTASLLTTLDIGSLSLSSLFEALLNFQDVESFILAITNSSELATEISNLLNEALSLVNISLNASLPVNTSGLSTDLLSQILEALNSTGVDTTLIEEILSIAQSNSSTALSEIIGLILDAIPGNSTLGIDDALLASFLESLLSPSNETNIAELISNITTLLLGQNIELDLPGLGALVLSVNDVYLNLSTLEIGNITLIGRSSVVLPPATLTSAFVELDISVTLNISDLLPGQALVLSENIIFKASVNDLTLFVALLFGFDYESLLKSVTFNPFDLVSFSACGASSIFTTISAAYLELNEVDFSIEGPQDAVLSLLSNATNIAVDMYGSTIPLLLEALVLSLSESLLAQEVVSLFPSGYNSCPEEAIVIPPTNAPTGPSEPAQNIPVIIVASLSAVLGIMMAAAAVIYVRRGRGGPPQPASTPVNPENKPPYATRNPIHKDVVDAKIVDSIDDQI